MLSASVYLGEERALVKAESLSERRGIIVFLCSKFIFLSSLQLHPPFHDGVSQEPLIIACNRSHPNLKQQSVPSDSTQTAAHLLSKNTTLYGLWCSTLIKSTQKIYKLLQCIKKKQQIQTGSWTISATKLFNVSLFHF